jgi:hypothetical protein
MHGRSTDRNHEQQAEGVHGDVTFTAVDLLAGVVAATGPGYRFGGAHRLGVDDRRGGLRPDSDCGGVQAQRHPLLQRRRGTRPPRSAAGPRTAARSRDPPATAGPARPPGSPSSGPRRTPPRGRRAASPGADAPTSPPPDRPTATAVVSRHRQTAVGDDRSGYASVPHERPTTPGEAQQLAGANAAGRSRRTRSG